jgi:hypothetical protein
LLISIRPNGFEGIENFADPVLLGMFNRETLQVVRDRDFIIAMLILRIVMFYSNAQFEGETSVLPINALEKTSIIWINRDQILA